MDKENFITISIISIVVLVIIGGIIVYVKKSQNKPIPTTPTTTLPLPTIPSTTSSPYYPPVVPTTTASPTTTYYPPTLAPTTTASPTTTYYPPTLAPTTTASPTTTSRPTFAPTTTASPTTTYYPPTLAPTTTSRPTFAPTTTASPTTTFRPTFAPTTTASPTLSPTTTYYPPTLAPTTTFRPTFAPTTTASPTLAPTTTPTMPIPQGEWEGWATTTQFGSGDAVWPGNNPSLCLRNIMERKNTMGAAVPWSVIAKFSGYANRKDFLNAIIRSCQGIPGPDGKLEEVCYLIEPLTKYNYPNQINNSSDFKNLCTSGCIDINDPSLAATITMPDGSTKKFGPYLIIPYEGCGGDCSVDKGVPDCFNSCSAIQDVVADFEKSSVGPECSDANPTNCTKGCEGIRILMNKVNGINTWSYDSSIEEQMVAAGFADIPISPKTNYGKNIDVLGGHANWCMGQNMHFDIAQDVPDWLTDLPANASSNIMELNASSNILVRYRKVPGNIFGNFKPQDPFPDTCFGGGYASGNDNTCGGVLSQVYTSNAKGCLAEGSDKPVEVSCCCPYGFHFDSKNQTCCANGDPTKCCQADDLDSCSGPNCPWPYNYSMEKNCCVDDSNNCASIPTSSGGGPPSGHCAQGQSFQAPGGSCPCDPGTCFITPTDTIDKTPGKCGKCTGKTNPTACAGWNGTMC